MSSRERHEPDELERDPQLTRALEALEPIRADSAFEARLRKRFLAGPAGAARPPDARPRPLRRIAMWGSLAAAALAVYLFVDGRQRSAQPDWEVIAGTRGEVVFVDGGQYSPQWETELGHALASGGRVTTPEGTALRLRYAGYLELDVGPMSSIVLPPTQARSAATRFYFLAEKGSLAIATGPEFPGSSLVVIAPDAEIEVIGTRLAIDVDDKGTCVCCVEGEVAMRPLASVDPATSVVAGSLGFATPDGTLLTQGEPMSEHLGALAELGDAWSQ